MKHTALMILTCDDLDTSAKLVHDALEYLEFLTQVSHSHTCNYNAGRPFLELSAIQHNKAFFII